MLRQRVHVYSHYIILLPVGGKTCVGGLPHVGVHMHRKQGSHRKTTGPRLIRIMEGLVLAIMMDHSHLVPERSIQAYCIPPIVYWFKGSILLWGSEWALTARE